MTAQDSFYKRFFWVAVAAALAIVVAVTGAAFRVAHNSGAAGAELRQLRIDVNELKDELREDRTARHDIYAPLNERVVELEKFRARIEERMRWQPDLLERTP